jgi:hypothetical protein
MASINFNAEQVEPQQSFDVLPKGKYLAMAIASDLKPTKNGSGQYLQFTFEIVDGQFKGRKIFERLNIQNSNKVAEDIAQRALSSFCRAVGVLNVSDSAQLHNLPVMIDLVIDEGKNGYSDQNRVNGYSAANGAAPRSTVAPAQAAPVAPAQTAAPAANGNTPVWKRKAA